MKDFILKYFSGKSMTYKDVTNFLYEYGKSKNREFTSDELRLLNQLVNQGILDIRSLCKEISETQGLQIYEIYNKYGNFITYKVYEIKS